MSQLQSEMGETSALLRAFNWDAVAQVGESLKKSGRLFISGEGSSRILPGHQAQDAAWRWNSKLVVRTQGSYQSMDYNLSEDTILLGSNSGFTKETTTLLRKLLAEGHRDIWGVTSNPESPLAKESPHTYVLKAGAEKAVAASKSIAEQTLFTIASIAAAEGRDLRANALRAADAFDEIFAQEIDPEFINRLTAARILFFAGVNDGVAEELTLKTNEICSKPSAFFEGTYCYHGPEEVMTSRDVIVFVNPFESEDANTAKIFQREVGCTVLCISSRPTSFPTIRIPSVPDFDWLLRLAAGWRLLIATGNALGNDVDHPRRARKVGNPIV